MGFGFGLGLGFGFGLSLTWLSWYETSSGHGTPSRRWISDSALKTHLLRVRARVRVRVRVRVKLS